MLARRPHRQAHPRGSVLAITILLLGLLSFTGLAILGLAMCDAMVTGRTLAQTQTFYAAERGLATGITAVRSLLIANPAPTPAQLDALPAPALPDPRFTLASYRVTQLSANPIGTIVDKGSYVGLRGTATDYLVAVTATGPFNTATSLEQVVHYVTIPLFQFGVFYGSGVDLEMAPGRRFNFNGRIHANSNIYLRADADPSTDPMTFQSYLTTAGEIYRWVKRDGPSVHNNNPQIADASGTLQTLNFDHTMGPNFSAGWGADQWASLADSTFGNKVLDRAMGVAPIQLPLPELFASPATPDAICHELIERPSGSDSASLQAAKLYNKSGLRIVNGLATAADGTAVTLPANVLSTKTFFDGRQNAAMTVTEIDVGRLAASGLAPSNGILYVSSDIANSGVRLVNGQQLPNTGGQGFTVVSDRPVYIQGDYNTANKTAAAVIADAVTVLSNNWAPNNSDAKANNQPATTTTINAALMLGPNAESTLGSGNGQLENLIRFLENWSAATIIYSGSLVALWHSQHAQGSWQGATWYTPPTRNYSFDTQFNTLQPPGAPLAVAITKGRWTQRPQ
jgi:hypothetical protein